MMSRCSTGGAAVWAVVILAALAATEHDIVDIASETDPLAFSQARGSADTNAPVSSPTGSASTEPVAVQQKEAAVTGERAVPVSPGNGSAAVEEWKTKQAVSFGPGIRVSQMGQEKYSKIPFFIFKAHSKREEKAKTAEDCEISCNERPTCKSYSFSARKSDCLWSTRALSFSGDFSFFSKRAFADPKASGEELMGRYRRFDGLMYQAEDFTRYQGQTLKECRHYCDLAQDGHGRKCNGFSYRHSDQTCLLSPYGLSYDPDYDYFERNAEPVPEMKEVINEQGKVVEVPTGKKVPPPVDVGFNDTKVAWNQSPQYKAQLQIQESAAKAGAIELGHKQRAKKRSGKAKKALEQQIEVMKEEQIQTKKKMKTGNAKAIKESIEKREAQTEKEDEETNKRYQLLLEKKKEVRQKSEEEAQRELERQHEQEQEKLQKELKMKTELKRQQAKLEAHKEIQRKKVNVLVQQGRALAHTERMNKEKAYNAAEHNAKEKIVKMQVEKVIANRHAKHEKEFDQFVKTTTERHLKTRNTDKQVSIAMKQTKKQRQEDLVHAQEELKATRAIAHAITIEIEKLKATADGYQHEINMDAKRGKKSPQAEVKLQYTMDNLRTEQNKEAYRRQEVEKLERNVLERQDELKKLDVEMTKKGIGRRRRMVEDATHAGPAAKKKQVPVVPTYEAEQTVNPALDRRRRTQARLSADYMSTAMQSAGDGRTVLPGVPSRVSTFTGMDPDEPSR